MNVNLRQVRELLQAFDFRRLFVEQLGWGNPTTRQRPIEAGGRAFMLREVAQLGAKVIEVEAANGVVPDAATRRAVHVEVARAHHEHLLIFVDRERRDSVWSWTKRKGGKIEPRYHLFNREQPTDLIVSKILGLYVDILELDEAGNLRITDVVRRLQQALDVERVTKRFYADYQQQHLDFLDRIEGIADERDRRWYASVLLNRLMFVYFLQKKAFLAGGDVDYLSTKLRNSQVSGPGLYYARFLRLLFFEGFAKPEGERSAEARALLGVVPYLNGGLFLEHRIERENRDIRIPDLAFANLLALFDRYSWTLDDTPEGKADEINPDVLGYIFEKYINQKAFGAYYTRPEITAYLCEQTLHRLVLDRMNEPDLPGNPGRRFDTVDALLLRLDAALCRKLLLEVLPKLTVLDPACGSGAFLVAALRTLVRIYSSAIGHAETLNDPTLNQWLGKVREHPSRLYFIRKTIVTDNLYGVDLMEEATEIARLRLFLALVSSTNGVGDLEPLPNIDFNILTGNSLIGLLHVEGREFDATQGQGDLFGKNYRQLVAEKDREIQVFRHTTTYHSDLRELRDGIDRLRAEAKPTLDSLLLRQFQARKIVFEQATWDAKEGDLGKPRRRPLTVEDVAAQQPFHWGYEFDQVLGRGGFDAILTNPPWETWKPQAKEFFAEHSDLVTKNKMTIKEFEKEQAKLLRDRDVREAWLKYLSRFPHVSLYFRTAPQYRNQIALVKGVDGKEKKAGTDVNLYKLFLEQCFNLLRDSGRCGILVPTGVYTDLGAKQLRQMLFEKTRITSLFGLSNERFLFEGVHHAFRICLLTFERGPQTSTIVAAFRMDPREAISAERLDDFLHNVGDHIQLPIELVRRLSPDSLSLMELKTPQDLVIAEKSVRFPLLGDEVEGSWTLRLANEFHMTNDSYLFSTTARDDRLPLYEGKMIAQFDHTLAPPRYWINESKGRRALIGEDRDDGRLLDYQYPRLAMRRVGANVDERTFIAAMLPANNFASESFHVIAGQQPPLSDQLFLLALVNTLVVDYLMRCRVAKNLSMFHIYQLPVPRLAKGDPLLHRIVEAAAALTCTGEEFAGLWAEVMGSEWSPRLGATDPAERARLRAELDGLVAHLYGLTEDEFTHVLSTFPVVPHETKDAALAAYRDLAPKAADPVLAPLLFAGEGARVEFKSTLRWDLREKRASPIVEAAIVKTVAGFLNAEGGTLLIGVADDGSPVGIEHDYAVVHKQNRDGFELHLTTLLLNSLGKDASAHLTTAFHRFGDRDVCRVEVGRSHHLVFVQEGKDEVFYLRTGNSTRKLTGSELLRYEKARFSTSQQPPSGPPAPGESSFPASSLAPTVGYRGASLPSPLAHSPLFRQASEPAERAPAFREAPTPVSSTDDTVAVDADADRAFPTSIDDVERYEVICVLRDLLSRPDAREGLDREALLRAVAVAVGFERLGPRIREVLEGDLLAAARRGVVMSEAGLVRLATRSIADYDREILREQLLAAAGTAWTDREAAIRTAARRIGFRRTGNQIHTAFLSVLRGALRQGKLEAKGDLVRRTRG